MQYEGCTHKQLRTDAMWEAHGIRGVEVRVHARGMLNCSTWRCAISILRYRPHEEGGNLVPYKSKSVRRPAMHALLPSSSSWTARAAAPAPSALSDGNVVQEPSSSSRERVPLWLGKDQGNASFEWSCLRRHGLYRNPSLSWKGSEG